MRNYSDLRLTLINILGEELGKYILPSQLELPAITIKSADKFPEAGTVIKGLEVVIIPETGTQISHCLGSIFLTNETRIILNQWDAKNDTNSATNLILKKLQPDWKISRIGSTVIPNWNPETIESRTVYLEDSKVYRWRNE